jgi:hypothetical protein
VLRPSLWWSRVVYCVTLWHQLGGGGAWLSNDTACSSSKQHDVPSPCVANATRLLLVGDSQPCLPAGCIEGHRGLGAFDSLMGLLSTLHAAVLYPSFSLEGVLVITPSFAVPKGGLPQISFGVVLTSCCCPPHFTYCCCRCRPLLVCSQSGQEGVLTPSLTRRMGISPKLFLKGLPDMCKKYGVKVGWKGLGHV